MNVRPDVYICPFRKNNTILFPGGDSKLYTSGSIASSQKMPTKVNESDAIAKIKISV